MCMLLIYIMGWINTHHHSRKQSRRIFYFLDLQGARVNGGELLLPWKGLTSVSHGAEDALGDAHDGVGGLVVAADGFPPAGELPDVLQEVMEGLADDAGSGTDLLQQLAVIRGSLAGPHAVLH